MAINKINRVVLHEDIKQELDDKATKQELQSTKEKLENVMNEIYQGIVWKPTVPTFDDLRIRYPNAKDGWKSTVEDTNITYQYDLETDTWFPTSINALPLATSKVDGLLAKEDKTKLDTVELNAQKNLTPQQTLEQIKTVDGKGSGLDSDLFQGRTPDSFADKEHEHDGVYYKKIEVDSFLNAKAPKSHVHSKEQITDFEHTHNANEIIENESKRFSSDIEKSNWNDANSKKHIHNNKTVLDKITQGLLDAWNTVTNKVDKAEGQGLSDENYTLAEKNKLKDIATGATRNDTDSNLKNRANHTGTQLSSTISNFADTVRSTVLTGLSTATNAVITATDTVLSALGKLQKQITDNLATLTSHIGNKSNPHDVKKADVDLGNVQNYGIATQAEAETGTSNAKYVTPLRVKQAIDKFKIKKVSELENDKNYVTSAELGNAGYGNMMKSDYDKNNNGIVDKAEDSDKLGGKSASEYATKEDMDNIEIGGRNLAIGTATDGFVAYNTGKILSQDSYPTKIIRWEYTSNGTAGIMQSTQYRKMQLVRGEVYTLSFEARGKIPALNYVYIMNTVGNNQSITHLLSTTTLSETSFKRVTAIFTKSTDSPYSYVMISSSDNVSGNWLEVKNIKIEKGNKATDWTPAHEDIQADIDTKTSKEYVDTQLNTKVDKVSGKQLSTEDYTTTEKTKLANIEYGANKYTHPATHPVDMIVGLHSIAKSGNYNDLSSKPTKLSQFENDIKSYHKGSTPPTNTNLLWLDTNS
ncbi:hypothetical protein [Tissierella pigra]|uniref:Uncharacterized protein n=1 Tax=Tissierella pigra TaxID=2607614 RepID=A0A6N7XWU5_9FIRM|nr:hypothetical protein [Tissierella pigra]MSU01923.1 hypothetical protein [Tissierella pigra]